MSPKIKYVYIGLNYADDDLFIIRQMVEKLLSDCGAGYLERPDLGRGVIEYSVSDENVDTVRMLEFLHTISVVQIADTSMPLRCNPNQFYIYFGRRNQDPAVVEANMQLLRDLLKDKATWAEVDTVIDLKAVYYFAVNTADELLKRLIVRMGELGAWEVFRGQL